MRKNDQNATSTCETIREQEKAEQTIFFPYFLVLWPSLKDSFSELRGTLELCFGYVGEELGGNRNLMWIFENLTWISPFWSPDQPYPNEWIVHKHQIFSRETIPFSS